MSNDSVIIMCPPLSDYPEAPKDQSHSELFDCPKCKEKMWLSDKKKGGLMFSACINKDIILACYHCITKIIEENPELVNDYKRVSYKFQEIDGLLRVIIPKKKSLLTV